LAALGRPAEAAAAIQEALPRLLPADRPAAVADLVEAQLAAGDLAGAEAALAGAGAGGAWLGIAVAGVRLARGDAVGAVAAAGAARDAAGELPLLLARARLVEGRALAATGDRAGALTALTAAEEAFSGFGARRWRDEATRELRRLGRRVVRPAESGDGPLTAREREIADLVAAGRTNREIAAQLVLSTRTIEAHLRTIYAKLGVRSRVELTRAVRA
jgi:DNA-binding CsgD family transcriptional regulator